MTTTSVKIDKYTIQHEDGANVRVLRNDLPWLEGDMLVGQKMLIAVADEIETLRSSVNVAVAQSLPTSNKVAWTIDCDSFPLHYSMSLDTAAVELKKLYEAWPGGLDEIESALLTATAQSVEPRTFKLLTYGKRLEMFGKASDDRATDYESYMQAIDDYESAFKVEEASSYNGDEIAAYAEAKEASKCASAIKYAKISME